MQEVLSPIPDQNNFFFTLRTPLNGLPSRKDLWKQVTRKYSMYNVKESQAFWCTPLIPGLGRLRKEDYHKFKARQGYIVRLRLKKKKGKCKEEYIQNTREYKKHIGHSQKD